MNKKMVIAALAGMGILGAQADIFTLENALDNGIGEVRATTNNVAGSTYPGVGDTRNLGNLRVGEYKNNAQGVSQISRGIAKFQYNETDLGITASSDVVSAILRLYITDNRLNASGDGSGVELFNSLSMSAGTAISTVASEFQEGSFSLFGDMGISSVTAAGAWYELDVTSILKADLDADGTGPAAGSVFRMQLNNDLSLDPSDGIDLLEFADNSDAGLGPQLVVETIPEPATLGMVALFGGAIVFIRRRLMM